MKEKVKKENVSLGSIDAICEKCGGRLNRGGVFEPALDFFNIIVKESKRKMYYYHTLLDFLGIDQYDKNSEKITKRTFYHKECIPEHFEDLIPQKEKIESYLETKDIGLGVGIEISKKEARETRLKPKIK